MNRYVYKVENIQEVLFTVYANSEDEAERKLQDFDYDDEEVIRDDYQLSEAELDEVEEDV